MPWLQSPHVDQRRTRRVSQPTPKGTQETDRLTDNTTRCMVKNTVKSANEISFLFDKALRSNQRTVVILCAQEEKERDQQGRVAYVAGQKLGNAPIRNRAKRLIREAAKMAKAPWQGLRVVIIAREACLHAEFEDICQDIKRGIAKLTGQISACNE